MTPQIPSKQVTHYDIPTALRGEHRRPCACVECRAADEMERLRARNDELERANVGLATESERRRAVLERLTDGYKYPTEVCQIAREALSGESASSVETKPEPDVGALNRQLCEAEGHVFSRFAMHHCLRCEAAVTPGGYLAYTSSQKAPETSERCMHGRVVCEKCATLAINSHLAEIGEIHDRHQRINKLLYGPGAQPGTMLGPMDSDAAHTDRGRLLSLLPIPSPLKASVCMGCNSTPCVCAELGSAQEAPACRSCGHVPAPGQQLTASGNCLVCEAL